MEARTSRWAVADGPTACEALSYDPAVSTWQARGPRTLERTQVYDLDSSVLGERLQVTVAEPPTAGDGHEPLATLVVLDPMATFDVVVGITRSLSLLAFGAFPPLLVVGVGYDADPLTTMSLRFRDLTPTDAPIPELLAPPVPPAHGAGGADRFLDAIVGDVLPHVASEHRGDVADVTVVGWSLAGLFGCHALLTRPEVFRRYLLASPSIWWDDAAILVLEERTAPTRARLDAHVYLAVGEREEVAETRAWPVAMPPAAVSVAAMVTNAERLVRRLRSRGTKGLDVHLEVLPDEHHTSIFPSAASRGLLHLFGPSAA